MSGNSDAFRGPIQDVEKRPAVGKVHGHVGRARHR